MLFAANTSKYICEGDNFRENFNGIRGLSTLSDQKSKILVRFIALKYIVSEHACDIHMQVLITIIMTESQNSSYTISIIKQFKHSY